MFYSGCVLTLNLLLSKYVLCQELISILKVKWRTVASWRNTQKLSEWWMFWLFQTSFLHHEPSLIFCASPQFVHNFHTSNHQDLGKVMHFILNNRHAKLVTMDSGKHWDTCQQLERRRNTKRQQSWSDIHSQPLRSWDREAKQLFVCRIERKNCNNESSHE